MPPEANQEAFAAEAAQIQANSDAAAEQTAQTLTQVAPPTNGRTFTEAEVAAIRKQEKDKLYGKTQELQEKLAVLEAAEQKRQAEAEKARQEQEALEAARLDAERKAAEAEMTWQERLEAEQRGFKDQLEQIRKERELEHAAMERERQYQALMDYRQQAIQAADGEIIPNLLDLVSGNTPEEIDSSINDLKARSAAIFEEAQAAMQDHRRNQPGTRVTSPGVGPSEIQSAQKTLTPEDIAGMSMEEYKQYRQTFIGNSPTNRGMFG